MLNVTANESLERIGGRSSVKIISPHPWLSDQPLTATVDIVIVATSKAHQFFEEHIVPSMREWEASPLEQHRAMNLAVSLNQMADYYWHEFRHDSRKVLSAKDVGAFRKALGAALPEFALVRDVADAHKHFKLTRADRQISTSTQATVGAIRWDEAKWDEGKWDSPTEIIVTYDDGSKHLFRTAVINVRDKWEAMLL